MDTSGWYCYFKRSEPGHLEIRQAITKAREIVTSNFVIDETLTLVLARDGHEVAVRAGEGFWSGTLAAPVRVTEADEREAWSMFRGRSGLSFTDCTSIALMKRLRLTKVVTLDEDFAREGYEVIPTSGR